MASENLSHFNRTVRREHSHFPHSAGLPHEGVSTGAYPLRMAGHLDGQGIIGPVPAPGFHVSVSGLSGNDSEAVPSGLRPPRQGDSNAARGSMAHRRNAATRGGDDDQSTVEALVTGAQEGDAASFAALYEHFFNPVFRYVSFRTGNRMDAEDITADVFVRMMGSISSFKWRGHRFSSWLFRIAHNLVVDYFRASARKKTVPLEGAAAIAESSSSNPERHAQTNLMMKEVYRAMESLTDWQREVISLRFAAGLSVAETAQAVGKKQNAVKVLQHAGLKKLKVLLASESSIPGSRAVDGI